MKTSRAIRFALPLLLAFGGGAVLPAAAAEAPGVSAGIFNVQRSSAREAQAMLDEAAEYLQRNPAERAFASFNNQKGRFYRGDLYVFAVGIDDGVMHAHGAAPEGLVGSDVSDLRDASGKAIIREMLEASKQPGVSSVDYVWLNRVSNRVEDKTSLVKRVGKTMLGVGYYVPRSSAEQARALLEKAAAAVRSQAPGAFAEFNNPQGGYVRGDLYVFAVGLDDGKFYAMGASPTVVGKDVSELHDAAGKPIIKDMIALAKAQGSGSYDYVWRNPVTNKVEHKHSLVARADNYLVGVGYYSR